MIYADVFQSLRRKVPGIALRALAEQGFRSWEPVSDSAAAGTDLKSLRAMQKFGVLRIWSGACDNTIYGGAYANQLARVWHDCVHLQLGKDFDFAGELAVATEQTTNTPELSLLERGAVWADTYGSVLYFHKRGRHVDNQLEFVSSFMSAGYRLP